jgi:hypothetical protein
LYDLSGEVYRPPPELESSFRLYPSRPNPFNPSYQTTSIVFDLARDCYVNITVYNILGQHIITLYDAIHPYGENYTYTWDGKDRYGNSVASGVYICQLRAEREKDICKFLLIK